MAIAPAGKTILIELADLAHISDGLYRMGADARTKSLELLTLPGPIAIDPSILSDSVVFEETRGLADHEVLKAQRASTGRTRGVGWKAFWDFGLGSFRATLGEVGKHRL